MCLVCAVLNDVLGLIFLIYFSNQGGEMGVYEIRFVDLRGRKVMSRAYLVPMADLIQYRPKKPANVVISAHLLFF